MKSFTYLTKYFVTQFFSIFVGTGITLVFQKLSRIHVQIHAWSLKNKQIPPGSGFATLLNSFYCSLQRQKTAGKFLVSNCNVLFLVVKREIERKFPWSAAPPPPPAAEDGRSLSSSAAGCGIGRPSWRSQVRPRPSAAPTRSRAPVA